MTKENNKFKKIFIREKFSMVSNAITQSKFFEKISIDSRYLYFLSLCNTNGNAAGIFRISKIVLSAQSGLSVEKINTCFKEMEGHIKYFEEENILWVIGYAQNHNFNSSNWYGVAKILLQFGNSKIIDEFLSMNKSITKLNEFLVKNNNKYSLGEFNKNEK